MTWQKMLQQKRRCKKSVDQIFRVVLMMKSMPGLPKLVQHLADYVVVFGIEVESGLTQS